MAAKKPKTRKTRRLIIGTERNQMRLEILKKVRERKSDGQIVRDLAINRNIFGRMVLEIRKGLTPKERIRFLEMRRENASDKFTPINARNLIRDSKKVLTGETAFIMQKPKDPLARFYKHMPAATKKAVRLIRGTNMKFIRISEKTGLSQQKVSSMYKILREVEQIPERRRGGEERNKNRITKWYLKNKGKIPKLMQQWEPRIVSTAESYCRNSTIFQRAGIYPDNIADYIRDSLEWKLKTFDPSRGKKMSEDIKLRNYISHQIKLLALDQLKIARRRKTQSSLGHNLTTSQEKPWTFMNILAAKPSARNIDPEKLIALIEEVSKKANLTTQEKAIIYAKAAGLKQAQIGKIVGVNESRISQVMISTKAKATKAGFSPKKK